jgi:hypothetical protein
MAATLPLNGDGNIDINSSTPADGKIKLTDASSGAGNNLTREGSTAGSGDSNGGNILLVPGTKSGSGNDGGVGVGVTTPKGLLQLAWSYIVAPAPTGTVATDRQNIIDAISAVGGYAGYAGTVYLQGGTYVISQTISLDLIGGVSLIGAGKDVTIIKMDSGTGQPVFEIKRDNFVTIKNLSIVSEQTNKSHTGLVITSSACFSNVENVAISGMNIGLYINRESYYNNFRNILVNGCNTGIRIGDDGGDGYLGDGNANNFYGGYIHDNSDYGILIYKGHGNLLCGLTVEGDGYHQYAGISLDGTGGNSVIGCFIERNTGYQVYINSPSNRVISNHFFRADSGDADFVYFNSYSDPSDGNVIFGNWFNGYGAVRKEIVLSRLGIGTTDPKGTIQLADKGSLDVTYPGEIALRYNHYYDSGNKWLTGSGKAMAIVSCDNGIKIMGSNDSSTGAGDSVTGWNDLVRVQPGGAVGINCTSPNAAALLQMDSTTKGFLPPRMSNSQMNSISTPPEGLLIYNTTVHQLCYYNGSSWNSI